MAKLEALMAPAVRRQSSLQLRGRDMPTSMSVLGVFHASVMIRGPFWL